MSIRRSRRRGMVLGAAIANSRAKNAAQPAPAQQPQPAAPEAASQDMVKQLTDLKSLLDSGVLTQEEFDAKKKQILAL